jgi:hypothetical protein
MSRRTPRSNAAQDPDGGAPDAGVSDLTTGLAVHRAPSAFVPSAKSIRASCIVVAVIVALSFASAPLLHLGQRAIRYRRTPVQERAWLVQPEQVGANGITRGQLVAFDITIASQRPITWSERTDGVPIASGVVSGTTGTVVHLTAKTTDARSHEWLTIWIGGIDLPLKVWVAH